MEKNIIFEKKMKIKAAIIGMGIGYKHFQAIEKYNNSNKNNMRKNKKN